MNIDNLLKSFNKLKTIFDNVISSGKKCYWNGIEEDLLNSFEKEGHLLYEDLKKLDDIKPNMFGTVDVDQIKPLIEKVLPVIDNEYQKIKSFEYKNLRVDDYYYKIKTMYHYDNNGSREIKYLVASFYTKQEHDAFLANLQKGLRTIYLENEYKNFVSIKNGYISKVTRCNDENIGDGIHAVVFHNDTNIIRVHKEDNRVDLLYKWLVANTKTGLLPEWKSYLYNELTSMELLTECEGFDITGMAPTVLVLSNEIDTNLLRTIKTQGLKNGTISMPVEENESFDTSMSFLELIQNYVIDNLKDEKAHYNVGEPISEIINSPIIFKGGKKTRLFPRQQVIGQGILNAVKDGKNSIFFNGGTGVGKTFSSSKVSYAIIKEHYKKDSGRIIIFAQGHLIPKWKRQMSECLNPIGIFPKFYEINSYTDVKYIPKSAEGIEIFLLPKDRVKRNYQVEYAANERFSYANISSIRDVIEDIKEDITEDTKYIFASVNLPITRYRLTVDKLERAYKVPTVLYKEQFNDDGEIEGYKVNVSSKLLKAKYGSSTKSYDFYLAKDSFNSFKEFVLSNLSDLTEELNFKSSKKYHQNGVICPHCKGLLYDKAENLFDEEKYIEQLHNKPSNKSESNSKCQNYIKADGTTLFEFEKVLIRNKEIETVYTEKKVKNSYIDFDGNSLSDDDLQKVKAGTYSGSYKILVTKCGSKNWSAMNQKGYRTVNAAEYMLKQFGKNSFDVLIADECHIYSKESEQGITYGVLCRLCKIVMGLTGTLTGGKASDLYYMFWRMFPSKLKSMGYEYKDVSKFVDHYGRKKKVTKEYQTDNKYNKSGIGKKTSSGWNEIPGMSPLLYTNFLSGSMVSRKLEDMGIPMPKLRYFKHETEMSDEICNGYDNLKDSLMRFMKSHEGVSLGGAYLHSLLSYTDMPNQEPMYWNDELIAAPMHIDISEKLLPKEIKLLETLRRELSEKRRVLVYSTYSGKKGVSQRLMEVIKKSGINVKELTSSVKLEKREDWIEKQYNEGVEVIVTNPEIVATGLDIPQYPTIYFYGLSYNVKTVRQAEKRAWRPGQDKECRIYYSFYVNTLQQDCIKLVGAKKKASLALEGVFSEDILSSMGEGGDSGASMLYKVLQGKVQLKESELDTFGFEDDTEIVNEVDLITAAGQVSITQSIENVTSQTIEKVQQMSLFTVSDYDIKTIKSKKTIEIGQIGFAI